MSDFGEKLVNEYFERVQRYTRLRVPSQDCSDVVADVFVRALEKQAQLNGDAGPWLFAIARSRIADYFRQKEAKLKMQLDIDEVLTSQATPIGASALTPLEQLEQAEFCALLQRQLNRLSELEREVIALKFTDGLTNTQIAQLLKITPNHLGVTLHRALRQLRNLMLQEVH